MAVTSKQLLADPASGAWPVSREEQAERARRELAGKGLRPHHRPATGARFGSAAQESLGTCAMPDGASTNRGSSPNLSLRWGER
jgi:hypothetical protein